MSKSKKGHGLSKSTVKLWDRIVAHVAAQMIRNGALTLVIEVTDEDEGMFEYSLHPDSLDALIEAEKKKGGVL